MPEHDDADPAESPLSSVSRRDFLKNVGGGSVVAVARPRIPRRELLRALATPASRPTVTPSLVANVYRRGDFFLQQFKLFNVALNAQGNLVQAIPAQAPYVAVVLPTQHVARVRIQESEFYLLGAAGGTNPRITYLDAIPI